MRGQRDFQNIYLTGDKHGSFHELYVLAQAIGITEKDLLIILGDVGLNFDNDMHDVNAKNSLYRIPAAILCIHGNHERRPDSPDMRWDFYEKDWFGGKVWYEVKYPRILYARDSCRFAINGRTFFVIGGAYSVDKFWRLTCRQPWFPDEQPSEEIRCACMQALADHGYHEDIILSHTCPYEDRPKDRMLPAVDQKEVDTSTEEFLQKIKDSVTYNKWYCGHWHIDRKTEDVEFLFNKVTLL